MTMVERRKSLLTFRSSNNGEWLGERDELSWDSLKRASKESLRGGEGFGTLKISFGSKKI